MDQEQLERMRTGQGFIAALDQSGGSTPKALQQYGISQDSYEGEDQMYTLVHAMRTRIITSPAFNSEYILGAILFEDTMNRTVKGRPTADYLWERKGIVPFLKIDKGLDEQKDGVQLMKPMPALDQLLRQAVSKNIFGTKMRSVIKEANPAGITAVVEQQFTFAKEIASFGLVPIIEPETDIHSPDRKEAERLLKQEIHKHLDELDKNTKVMFKMSIPVENNFYRDLMSDPRVVRVVALSGGFSREEANSKLAQNKGLIASFSRALAEGLSVQQNDDDFNETLAETIQSIYKASVIKTQ